MLTAIKIAMLMLYFMTIRLLIRILSLRLHRKFGRKVVLCNHCLAQRVRITGPAADRSLCAKSIQMTKAVMDLDPSRLVTCASGWTDQPVGHVLDVHVYPGPTNGGTGNIPVYSGPTNGETGNILPCIQNQPIGEQVTFHVLFRTNQWGNR
jgi:hypothetical protein